MADTIGSLVDKLATVNNKMFWNQEFLYMIREMSLEHFLNHYHFDEKYAEKNLTELYEKLKKVVDLNLQRQALILEHDRMLVNMILEIAHGPNPKEMAESYVFDQHKTLKTEE